MRWLSKKRSASLFALAASVCFCFLQCPALGLDEALPASIPVECALDYQQLGIALVENDFNIVRRLHPYRQAFGLGFTRELLGLGNGHWLDAGAGSGNAIMDARWYFRLFGRILPWLKPRITAVGIKKPEAWNENIARLSESERERTRYLDDQYIEKMSDEDLLKFGKVNLITDMAGPLAYSLEVDKVLGTYLRILDKKGTIYSSYGWASVILPDGKQMRLFEWLKTIDGLEVKDLNEGHLRAAFAPIPVLDQRIVRIRKLREDVKIPRLRIKWTLDGRPPMRFFEVVPEGEAQ